MVSDHLGHSPLTHKIFICTQRLLIGCYLYVRMILCEPLWTWQPCHDRGLCFNAVVVRRLLSCRAGSKLITNWLVDQIPAPTVHMLKYPWATRSTVIAPSGDRQRLALQPSQIGVWMTVWTGEWDANVNSFGVRWKSWLALWKWSPLSLKIVKRSLDYLINKNQIYKYLISVYFFDRWQRQAGLGPTATGVLF